MSEVDARMPHHKWIVCAAAGVVLLLWTLWQVLPVLRQMLHGGIDIVQ
jgi:hypothetical protein